MICIFCGVDRKRSLDESPERMRWEDKRKKTDDSRDRSDDDTKIIKPRYYSGCVSQFTYLL